MWDATTQVANAAMALGHVALAAVCVRGWRRSRAGSIARPLTAGLAVFFLTGVVSHGVLAAGTTAGGWTAARAAVTAVVVVPYTARGLLALSRLPAKEELAQLVSDRDHFIRVLNERNGKLRAEADRMRETIEHVRWRTVADDEYQRLREDLHRIRNVG